MGKSTLGRIVRRHLILAMLALALLALARPADAAPGGNGKVAEQSNRQTLSTRVVAYRIEAKLDVVKKTITASETLTYHNLTGQPQQAFPFHLYLNGFQPHSTFTTEANSGVPEENPDPANLGSITIGRITVAGMGDVTDRMQFIHPDDDNAADRTVMQVTLPKPVPAGADVQFTITFTDKLPRVVARTGYIRDFFMVGQWFPKVGVWWKGAWNCHQFHSSTEFFADFGTYEVKLTLPQNEIVGATGALTSTTNNSDGSKTLVFRADDVHDFAWTASPSFRLIEDSWKGSAGTVNIHLLVSPGNMSSAARFLESTKGGLRVFDEWIGPYPYDQLTVVDPPHGGLAAGGMEYPTLFTADTFWYMPKGALIPEITAVHEFAHQYFYGMVGTNEFEEAWLDEGITSYMEAKVMNELYGKGTSVFKFPFLTLGDTDDHRVGLASAGYWKWTDTDPLTRLGWRFYSESSYADVTYGKTTQVLTTLEKLIGEETMRRALHIYFLRYRFTHPTGEDFLRTIEEVSGRDLRWYFNQAVYGTNLLDYEILDAHSEALPADDKAKKDSRGGAAIYRTFVTVHRKGDFIFPEDVKITFSDKSSVMEHWDGQDRWIRYQYDRPAELLSAEIDPGDTVTLDLNFYNNSYAVKEDHRAIHKLTNIWTFIAEWVSQMLAWLT
jgi:Peptidase family M1 domain